MDNDAALKVGVAAAVAVAIVTYEGVAMASSNVPVDEEGSGSASPSNAVSLVAMARGAFSRATGGILSNETNLPTDAQKAAWVQARRRKLPNVIVPRVRTPITDGINCRRLSAAAAAAAGVDPKGGDVLATLVSIETNAGVRPDVACWNYNPGNAKGNHFGGPVTQGPPSGYPPSSSRQPVYFLVDRINSLDFYPSFDTLQAGLADLVRLLRTPNYNRGGMMGARLALESGNLYEFNRALGAGGYAASYRTPGYMSGRYLRMLASGALPRNGVVLVPA